MSWFFDTGRKIEKLIQTIRKVQKVRRRLLLEDGGEEFVDIVLKLKNFEEEFENGCSENLSNGKFDRFLYESQATLIETLLELTETYRNYTTPPT